jgi:dTDP-glucose pyrophosphorylase
MIVIPMAGLSRRFADAGYELPKYMLDLDGDTVFFHVLKSFKAYYDVEDFLFICRNTHQTQSFITNECNKLRINNFKITVIPKPTTGQAETVLMGLKGIDFNPHSSITIFNIDTVRPDFSFPSEPIIKEFDGFLEVFRGEGDDWSFVKTISKNDMHVVETAEKKRISDLCSTGLYHFAHATDFIEALEQERHKPKGQWHANELYIAPLYNHLIKKGKKIFAVEVLKEKVIACGTPKEYRDLKNKTNKISVDS